MGHGHAGGRRVTIEKNLMTEGKHSPGSRNYSGNRDPIDGPTGRLSRARWMTHKMQWRAAHADEITLMNVSADMKARILLGQRDLGAVTLDDATKQTVDAWLDLNDTSTYSGWDRFRWNVTDPARASLAMERDMPGVVNNLFPKLLPVTLASPQSLNGCAMTIASVVTGKGQADPATQQLVVNFLEHAEKEHPGFALVAMHRFATLPENDPKREEILQYMEATIPDLHNKPAPAAVVTPDPAP